MNVDRDTVVSIDYTLTNDAGDVLDSSRGSGPLTYIHGRGQLVSGLEAALGGGNHPLAGMPLSFDVTVIGVRRATDEELAHGHVHAPGDPHR